jgi:hypothetical protein
LVGDIAQDEIEEPYSWNEIWHEVKHGTEFGHKLVNEWMRQNTKATQKSNIDWR